MSVGSEKQVDGPMTENNISQHTRGRGEGLFYLLETIKLIRRRRLYVYSFNKKEDKMFHDRDSVTGADVSSSWKMSVSVSESSCQTMPSTTAEVSCQAREAASSETQTDAGQR